MPTPVQSFGNLLNSLQSPQPGDPGLDMNMLPGNTDWDPSFTLIGQIYGSGTVLLAQAICNRLTTPLGTLRYAPQYGEDVRSYLNDAWTPAIAAARQAAIQTQCLQDQRVSSVLVSLTYNTSSQTVSINITGTGSVGPFALTLLASAVSVTLLDANRSNS